VNSIDNSVTSMLELKCGQSLDSEKNVDVSSLPPARVCLNEHIWRVNYQLAIRKHALCPEPDVPHAAADNGLTMNDGKLQRCWFKGAVFLKSTTDILGQCRIKTLEALVHSEK